MNNCGFGGGFHNDQYTFEVFKIITHNCSPSDVRWEITFSLFVFTYLVYFDHVNDDTLICKHMT